MSYQTIKYEVEEEIAVIRINRPEALNVLNVQANTEIADALEAVKANKSIRALIITGDARAFAAGADLAVMSTKDARGARLITDVAVSINNTLENLPIPTIAAVAGYALGGGLEMPIACDFRVGGPRSQISFPEVGLGIIPGANGCVRAVSLVGAAKAKELILMTPTIFGEEAYKIGLLTWYVEAVGCEELNRAAFEAKQNLSDAKKTGDEEAVNNAKKAYKEAEAVAAQKEFEAIFAKAWEVAKTLKEKPACAIAAAKASINRAANETLTAGRETEKLEFSLLFDTKDQKEGMTAMLEKRKPHYTGS